MAKILVRFNESSSRTDAASTLTQRMMSFYNDEGNLLFIAEDNSLYDFLSKQYLQDVTNNAALLIGLQWSGSATNVQAALEELRTAVNNNTIQTFNWRGEWSSGSNYAPYDLVEYNGSTYICTNTVTGGTTAPDTSADWDVFVEGGTGGGGCTTTAHVSTETGLSSALSDDTIDNIHLCNDIEITSGGTWSVNMASTSEYKVVEYSGDNTLIISAAVNIVAGNSQGLQIAANVAAGADVTVTFAPRLMLRTVESGATYTLNFSGSTYSVLYEKLVQDLTIPYVADGTITGDTQKAYWLNTNGDIGFSDNYAVVKTEPELRAALANTAIDVIILGEDIGASGAAYTVAATSGRKIILDTGFGLFGASSTVQFSSTVDFQILCPYTATTFTANVHTLELLAGGVSMGRLSTGGSANSINTIGTIRYEDVVEGLNDQPLVDGTVTGSAVQSFWSNTNRNIGGATGTSWIIVNNSSELLAALSLENDIKNILVNAAGINAQPTSDVAIPVWGVNNIYGGTLNFVSFDTSSTLKMESKVGAPNARVYAHNTLSGFIAGLAPNDIIQFDDVEVYITQMSLPLDYTFTQLNSGTLYYETKIGTTSVTGTGAGQLFWKHWGLQKTVGVTSWGGLKNALQDSGVSTIHVLNNIDSIATDTVEITGSKKVFGYGLNFSGTSVMTFNSTLGDTVEFYNKIGAFTGGQGTTFNGNTNIYLRHINNIPATSYTGTAALYYEKASIEPVTGGTQLYWDNTISDSLQNVYDNSTDPEIVTDATRGALTLKRGSTLDSDSVLEIQNGAGSNTTILTGNGQLQLDSATVQPQIVFNSNGGVDLDHYIQYNPGGQGGITLKSQQVGSEVTTLELNRNSSGEFKLSGNSSDTFKSAQVINTYSVPSDEAYLQLISRNDKTATKTATLTIASGSTDLLTDSEISLSADKINTHSASVIGRDPVASNEFATKNYTDSAIGSAVVGSAVYKGAWNASNNTPDLTSVAKAQGDFYIVSVAGNTLIDGVSEWSVGDWVLFNGTTWEKVDNSQTIPVNVGTGVEVFKSLNNTTNQADFRTLVGGTKVGFTQNTNDITVDDSNVAGVNVANTFTQAQTINGDLSLTSINSRIKGGFGTVSTAGVLDWDDVSNSTSGSGYTLLTTTATNSPQNSGINYWYPFTFEHTKKDGSGNRTQMAIPYGNLTSLGNLNYRSYYNTGWTGWREIIATKEDSRDVDFQGVVNLASATNGSPGNGDIWYDGDNLIGVEDSTSFNLSGLYGTSADTDLNNYTQDGKYLTPSTALTNAPAGFTTSSRRLIQVSQYALGTSNYIIQTLYSINDNKVAWRVYATASWSEWHEVPYMVDDVLKLQSTTNGSATTGDVWYDGSEVRIEGGLIISDGSFSLKYSSSTGALEPIGFAAYLGTPSNPFSRLRLRDKIELQTYTNSSPATGDIWRDSTSGAIEIQGDTAVNGNLQVTGNINVRIGTTTSTSSLSIDTDLYDQYNVTSLAVGMTINAPSGGTDGKKLIIRIKDNGTAKSLDLTIFRAIGVTLPTTTTPTKTIYVGCIYNNADSKWDVIAVAEEA
jgi:hypothetical protein